MDAAAENFMPVLSTGRHRNARRGACFMEYASYLAGLHWSDHPTCTHPTLAALARLVNDLTSDAARSRLAEHVTSVIGLVGDDPRIPVVLSSLAAASALPVANQSRQRALATALIRCDGLLAKWDGPEIDRARMRIRVAFLMAPGTEEWARRFLGETALSTMPPISVNEEAILRTSAIGIADACVQDADARLEKLLIQAINECTTILAPAQLQENGHQAQAPRELQSA
jgi:hypothetical protein